MIKEEVCICVWNLKPRVQLKVAAVRRSAPGLIGQRWSVKQPATQEFANTSCHLCGSLVDFRWRRCCCGKKLSPCHVCLVEGAELLEASLSSKAGNPSAPRLSTPPWREGRNLFLGTRTWPTSSNAALMFVTFFFFFPLKSKRQLSFLPSFWRTQDPNCSLGMKVWYLVTRGPWWAAIWPDLWGLRDTDGWMDTQETQKSGT